MFDPERLLGQLLTKGIRRGARKRGIHLGSKAMLGMGAIGVAMAAYEHFTQQNSTTPQSAPPPPPPNTSMSEPQSTEAMRSTRTSSPPPPPPQSSPGAISPDDGEAVATLLIRAMIAAANADGAVDDDEAAKILDAAAQDGMDEEERAFLIRELDKPQTLEQIATTAGNDQQLCEQVYVASLAAVDVDTELERDYLNNLASRLSLSNEQVHQLHANAGIGETN